MSDCEHVRKLGIRSQVDLIARPAAWIFKRFAYVIKLKIVVFRVLSSPAHLSRIFNFFRFLSSPACVHGASVAAMGERVFRINVVIRVIRDHCGRDIHSLHAYNQTFASSHFEKSLHRVHRHDYSLSSARLVISI
jgi:hypothetical protein